MKKTMILIILAAGALSFISSFGVSFFLKKKSAQESAQAASQNPALQQAEQAPSKNDMTSQQDIDAEPQRALAERQVQNLIFDLREKIQDYQNRQRELDYQTQQLEIAKQTLQTDLEKINQLYENLSLALASLNEKQRQLEQSLLEIEQIEKANFQRLASTYEKMDAAQAGKIMLSMAAGSQIHDVVKILYYMNDRNAGKVLGEIAASRPEVAGAVSLQLKRVKEGK